MQLVERSLDVTRPDLLGDELVEVQAALQAEVDKAWEVAAGQAALRPNTSISGMSGTFMSGGVPARSRA